MALKLADLVQETTNTTGTGTLTLAGAVAGPFQSFAAVGDGNTTYYAITSGNNWEVGVGTYTASGTTLSRDTVLSSSAGGAKINVAAGAKVSVVYPASKSISSTDLHTDEAFAGSVADGVIIDYVDPYARISVGTGDGVRIFTGGLAGTQIAEFKSNGDTDISGVLSVGGGSLIGGATNPQIAAAGSSSSYVQAYIHNDTAGASSSADFAAYPDNGTDAAGWVDMGMTSSVYSDTSYSVTGPNEAYLFGSAPTGAGATGNLVYATDATGSVNAHQWYVGGFNQAKSAYKMQLNASNLYVKQPFKADGLIESTTGGFKFPDGTTQTTAATGGSGSPGGASGEIQYNNAGTFAGAANVEVENGYLRLPDTGTQPTTPATGGLDLFSRNRGGRILPAWIGPSGLDSTVQPALFGNSQFVWLPGTGTTLAINWGCSFTARNSGTSAAQATPARASTNAMTSLNRSTFGTGTTATGASGVQSASTVAWRGNAAGLGGFFFFARFGIETLASDMRAFVGLSANNAAMAADASTWNNTIGIEKGTADSVWYVVERGTANTRTSSGCTVTAGQVLDLHIFCPPNGSTITIRLADAVTGTVYLNNTVLSTTLPGSTTFLYMQAHCQSVTGTTAKLLALNRLYCENDL
jgi:hypothetical protein